MSFNLHRMTVHSIVHPYLKAVFYSGCSRLSFFDARGSGNGRSSRTMISASYGHGKIWACYDILFSSDGATEAKTLQSTVCMPFECSLRILYVVGVRRISNQRMHIYQVYTFRLTNNGIPLLIRSSAITREASLLFSLSFLHDRCRARSNLDVPN